MPFPTTSRPSPPPSSPTGSCSATRSKAISGRPSSATPSTGFPRSEMRGGSPRAPLTAALGAAFIGAGLAFGLTVALVCGVGLLLLAGGAVAWVELATAGGRLERERGPTRIDERSAYPLRLRLLGTLLPPPGGELRDPLLERPVAVGPRWRRLSRNVSLEGPGRRKLGVAQLIVEDPLGLWRRERHSATGDDLIVLPRVEPVHWDEGGGAVRGRTDGSGGGSDAPSGRGGPAQFEVDGLRPY